MPSCEECGLRLLDGRADCPHCGASRPPDARPLRNAWWLVALGLALLLVVARRLAQW
jgi:MYXO-CTERM domain-containing protein